jgi:twitching motility two-component system response regulator PilH
MSEVVTIPPLGEAEVKKTPTVYFIDDSATMREVIKIAFRRENIHVITCADAAAALGQFQEHPPDVVITDVIMPDQDGYSVCSQIKQSETYSKTPVILMSGVVNKSVADRAVAVKADELVRKPFQPQELIGRVKNLLGGAPAPMGTTTPPMSSERPAAPQGLSGLFVPPATSSVNRPVAVPNAPPAPAAPAGNEAVWSRALADAFQPPHPPAAPSAPATNTPGPANVASLHRAPSSASDVQKLKAEIAHLQLLIKKLQTELQIERQYNQALELHVRTLTHVD